MERRAAMIRVLGPIDLLTDSGAIAVGGRRPRALLGALVVGAGNAVPIERLIAVVWGERPPRSAVNTLGSYISNLRRVLGGLILRTDHSYELDLTHVDLDVLVFERLVRRAECAADQPAVCWELCRDALALWRGRPFGDLADDEPFALEALRLDELRLVAMELSLASDVALGRHELVVGELESAVREHPYRERLWFLLMQALAQGERRVEALRAGSELRRVLAEAGVGIGDDIADLEQRILRGDEIHR